MRDSQLGQSCLGGHVEREADGDIWPNGVAGMCSILRCEPWLRSDDIL